MAVDLKAMLTRKVGPLPVWAWGGIGAGAGFFIMRRRGEENGALEEVEDFEFLPAKAVSGAGEEYLPFEDEIEPEPTDIISEDDGGPTTGGGPPDTQSGLHGPDMRAAIRKQGKLIEKLQNIKKQAKGAQKSRIQKQIMRAKAVRAALAGRPAQEKRKAKAKGKK